ncbi:phenazine biosynthesis protein PhzF family [Nitrosomonas aestuarii]|uniref:Phenazine biosynthesis protein PhzF family n=1 Tax=Nitrosomonas aestuarii TaxID=52441 RepID=A0A1I4GWT6_9PROT|nr:PhzF family phenazine biosynthesis protein [Nitrosomonas aestuarii]SFL34010.1 phenazine biosynthesis protein PhzF family [Nitrosomonas aestuarii]
MNLKQYQVDAFATRVFEGNPAAVCPLEKWLDDSLLQAIANENNLSETAFFVPTEHGFHLRWFTPVTEVDLCGHATLAAAHVLFDILEHPEQQITFQTKSGELVVESKEGLMTMDFPARPPMVKPIPDALVVGLGHTPQEVWVANNYIAVFEDEETLRSITPDFAKLQELDLRGVIVTAPGKDVDFVSRFFAPKIGIPEDPVTGAAHCELTPYWSQRLEKKALEARQISPRGGKLSCQLHGNRVILSGKAVTFMIAEIYLSL